jgi:exopolyphosphatase/guanosine-5'-triphosphate,3'-diphosphate pyrophosphatase
VSGSSKLDHASPPRERRRVAVVDIGTNSTRLLVAEVDGGDLAELQRESIVTRLGEGVDATGRLGDAPMQRVFAALDRYAEAIERHGAASRTAVLTSAVRDAANGDEFAAAVRERYGLDALTLSGAEEARLTYLGATASRSGGEPLVVIDIGGGSTELVVGVGDAVEFHTSTQVGVVRHSERHLHSDPPAPEELRALAEDARAAVDAVVPEARPAGGIATGGTATQLASVDLGLAEHDRERVEGHTLSLATLRELRDRLAALPLEQRRGVRGLDPARAPTIVAGVTILIEAVGAFGLDGVEVSERDILWGVALDPAQT